MKKIFVQEFNSRVNEKLNETIEKSVLVLNIRLARERYGKTLIDLEEITGLSKETIEKLVTDFNGLYSYWQNINPIKVFYYVVNDKYKGAYASLYAQCLYTDQPFQDRTTTILRPSSYFDFSDFRYHLATQSGSATVISNIPLRIFV